MGREEYRDQGGVAGLIKNYQDFLILKALYEGSGGTKTGAYRDADLELGRKAFYNRFDRFLERGLFEREAADHKRGPEPYEALPAADRVMEEVEGKPPEFFDTLSWRTAWQEDPPEYGDVLDVKALSSLGSMSNESNYILLKGLANSEPESLIQTEAGINDSNFRERWRRLERLNLADRNARAITEPGEVLIDQLGEWEDEYGFDPIELGRAFYSQEPDEFLTFLKYVDGVDHLIDIQNVADISQNVMTTWLTTLEEFGVTYREGPESGEHVEFGRGEFGEEVLEFVQMFGRVMWEYKVGKGIEWVFESRAENISRRTTTRGDPWMDFYGENIGLLLENAVRGSWQLGQATDRDEDSERESGGIEYEKTGVLVEYLDGLIEKNEVDERQEGDPGNPLEPGSQPELEGRAEQVLQAIGSRDGMVGSENLEREFPGLNIPDVLDTLDDLELITQKDGYETLTPQGKRHLED